MTISKTARVFKKAQIGANVTVGDYTVIQDNVIIGDNVTIESHCLIGHPTPLSDAEPLVIGNNSLIRSHSIFYEGSRFGPKLITGHHVTVREKIEAGESLQIGTLSDLQGYVIIGNHVRFHSNVHIGQKSIVDDFVWIFPYTVLTNDPHPPSNIMIGVRVNKFAVIASMCCVLPGVQIGEKSLVAAGSLVKDDVEPETVVAGVPAKFLCNAADIHLRDGSGDPAYPWIRHFHRGYPQEITDKWVSIFNT